MENTEEDNTADKGMYQGLVEKLIYFSHTRPNVAFAVSLVIQLMHWPMKIHLYIAFRIVQYLKGTLGRGILFERNKSVGLKHMPMPIIQGQLYIKDQLHVIALS